MLRCLFSLGLVVAVQSQCWSQDLQLEEGAVGQYLALKSLQHNGSVLHVVAHPDDEDGAMLAYCARGLGARTMLFSITRGEGGANMISSHFFDELGALRTLEHLKAASYYGIEVFYSRAADYGYSKTLREAMSQWDNGLPILKDLVEVIRREQPTVIVSRFAGDPRDGHGHHQMAGVLSRKAFEAAADPQQFPEQIAAGLAPWQAKKLYVRAGSPWRKPEPGAWSIELPVGKYDPVIGKSYAQVARFGLGFQRSQGITGHDADAGSKSSYYRLMRTAGSTTKDSIQSAGDSALTTEESFFDNVDVSWSALLGGNSSGNSKIATELKAIDGQLQSLFEKWNPRTPQALIPAMCSVTKSVIRLRDQTRRLPAADRALARLAKQLERATIRLSGIELKAWATDADGEEINFATPGEKLNIEIRLANQSSSEIQVPMFLWSLRLKHRDNELPRFAGGEISSPQPSLLPSESLAISHALTIPVDAQITRPHWSREDIASPTYDVRVGGQQRPMPRQPIEVSGRIRINGTPMDVLTTLEVRRRDPEFGNVRYPLSIVPDKSLSFELSKRIVPNDGEGFKTQLTVRSNTKSPNSATVSLKLPPGWTSAPDTANVQFQREGDVSTVGFDVSVPANAADTRHTITAVAKSSAGEFSEGFETVTARDLDRMNVFHGATQQVTLVDVRVAGMPRVGYITGSGDKVAESLAPLGIAPTILSESDLAKGNLQQFDVIFVGVRAYAVRDDVRTHNARLLNYVRKGGVLIVQYQTPEFDQNFGPYPYVMGPGPEEVSEEDAAVTILQPQHSLFKFPNKITERDFDGWFEQRGSKFLASWDKQYTPLLECHDTGQAPQQGGQMIAQFGKGVYVYSAYAWYRQLPQGVPGAYRLFANMLSLPESDLVK